MNVARQTTWTVGALTLMLLSQLGSARGEELSLASYEDLAARVEQLESQLQETQGVNYGVGCDSAGCYGHDGCGGCGCCGGYDSGCCGGCQCWDYCDCCGGRFFGGVEVAFLTPHFEHNTAFQVFDDPNFFPNDNGTSVQFDWDLEASPRVWLGWVNPCYGIGWRTRYWSFDHDTTRSAIDPPGQTEVRLAFDLDDPDINLNIDDGNTLEATHALDVDVWDFEGVDQYRLGCCGMLTLSGGIRYLRMRQEFLAREVEVPNDFISATHTFEGVGPTVAIEYRRCVRRIQLFTMLRFSAVYGESDNLMVEDAGAVDGYRTEADNDLIPIGEMQVGAEWTRCVACDAELFVRAAMEGQYWLGAGSGFVAIGEDDTPHDNQNGNMGFYGFTLGVGLRR